MHRVNPVQLSSRARASPAAVFTKAGGPCKAAGGSFTQTALGIRSGSWLQGSAYLNVPALKRLATNSTCWKCAPAAPLCEWDAPSTPGKPQKLLYVRASGETHCLWRALRRAVTANFPVAICHHHSQNNMKPRRQLVEDRPGNSARGQLGQRVMFYWTGVSCFYKAPTRSCYR